MWFAEDCNIYTNPKTLDLAAVLKLTVNETVGMLGRLWGWAVQSDNESGDISHLPAEEIAAIMRWNKKPEVLLCALITNGFIDADDNGKFIHDWQDLNGKLLSKKRYDRERKT